MEDRYTFLELLPMFRARAGLNQAELAGKLGVHRNTVGAWENGKQPPGSRNAVLDLADALGLDAADTDRLLFALNYGLEHQTPAAELRRTARMDAELVAIREGLARVEAGVGELLERVRPAEDIAALVGQLSGDGGTATITGIRGMGGIGKTELALVVAERLCARYGDAGLMFELQPGDVPLAPEAVLANVIHAFEPEAKLPEGLAELQGIYREALAGKRGVLLLDNAAGAEQVRPLLPAPAGWAVLVTSRARFPLPGARLHDLELLPPAEAVALLGRLLSDGGRGDGEQGSGDAGLRELAERCGRLPLALRVAAGYLTTYADWSLADYLAALEGAQLKYLAAPGEPSVQAVLGVSIERLRERDAVLAGRWAQLAAFPAPFDRAAAAAVWGELAPAPAEDVRAWPELTPLGEEETRAGLSALVQQSLVEGDAASGMYMLHDLLRECAVAGVGRNPEDRGTGAGLDGARLRHAWHYLGLGREANALYMQGGEGVVAGLRVFEGARPHLAGAWAALAAPARRADAAAQRWVAAYPDAVVYVLDLRLASREQIAVLAAGAQAAAGLGDRGGEGGHLGNLGRAYAALGEAQRAIGYYEQALAISRAIGDRGGEGADLGNLGSAYWALGEAQRAIGYYEQALAISRAIGDRRGEGNHLGNLGLAYAALGEAQRAIGFFEQALAISREIGDRRGEGNRLGNLGSAYWALGEAQRAIGFQEQALAISREIGDRRGEGADLGNLGLAYADLGEAQRASETYEQALAISREIGDRRGEGNHVGSLGNAYAALGDAQRAIGYHEQALAISRAIGDRRGEGADLGNLGSAYYHLGEAQRAIGSYEQALAISREIGDRPNEGAWLNNLGTAYAALGEAQRARELWQGALRIFEEIQSPHAATVRKWLAENI